MDPDRGEANYETEQSIRRKAKEILGNRPESLQISDSGHIRYFIQYIEEQKDR